jgi:hypothetical protein
MRRVASTVLLVVAGMMVPVFLLAGWAGSTLYDSDQFSERAVEPLNSEAVRQELSRRLTEQLIQAGNQQASNFRPAFELALEGVIDTDTFKSIFRNAVRRTHESIIEQGEGGGSQGLDLGASFSLITASLQGGGGEQQGASGLDSSLSDITGTIDDFGLWSAEGIVGQVGAASLILGLAAAAGSILLAEDRRRAVRRLGIAAVIGGLFIVVLLFVATWFVGRQIDDGQLGDAIKGALGEVTDDLRLSGLWIAAYGLVVAAAAARSDRRYTPAHVWNRARGWVERRRRTTKGTILLGVLGLFISLVFIQEPLSNFELLIRAAALWVGYLAVTELLRLVRTIAAERTERRAVLPRLAIVGGTLVVIAGLVTIGFVLTTRGAARAAEAGNEQLCNGDKSLCDLRLDQVTFPGSHNSMSSANYPGFLFAEQIGTIRDQLDSGVRALLIDSYYGVPSTARIPGQNIPVVLTDKVAQAAGRAEVNTDPAAAKRAAQLASRAPPAANAERGIYLCHSNCETGAVRFGAAMNDIKTFLDTHPDDVLMVVIQDATTPDDTAAAIQQAGLTNRVATLEPGAPLPTLRDLIDNGRTLLVFAERGDPGGPPWYHNMYDWFQETTFSFNNQRAFNCQPNRGNPDAPLFLINHWVTKSPPDPGLGATVNKQGVLESRVNECLSQRGLVPNILAVDFAESGEVVSSAEALNEGRLQEERRKRTEQRLPAEQPPVAEAEAQAAPGAQLPEPTPITTLTGGDPVRFCRVLSSVTLGVTSWAQAVLSADPADVGLSDYAYAPLLARDLDRYVKVAPQELVERAAPILDRARSAIASLEAQGLSKRDIKRLADSASRALLSPQSPDGIQVQADVIKQIEKKVDPQALRQAATEFIASQPDAVTLLDLGLVPREVGIAAGYPCASAPE